MVRGGGSGRVLGDDWTDFSWGRGGSYLYYKSVLQCWVVKSNQKKILGCVGAGPAAGGYQLEGW